MADPAIASRRERLIAAALDLLDEEGPGAVTTRRLAKRAGLTTMAFYTEFGSLAGLVRAVVDAGFDQLSAAFAALEQTADPISDLLVLGTIYRQRAQAQPHLYAVMFGTATLGGYRRTGDELTQGLETFTEGVRLVRRAMDDQRLTDGDPLLVTAQLWSALHGQLVLEMSGMLNAAGDPFTTVLVPLFSALIVGLGDDPNDTLASIASARNRTGLPEPPAGDPRDPAGVARFPVDTKATEIERWFGRQKGDGRRKTEAGGL
jgi:AcrR family transcriptional regulator